MVRGAGRGGPSKVFALLVPAIACVVGVGGSSGQAAPAFSFDMGKCHESISVLERGTVAFKEFGDDYQSVLLKPAVSPGTTGYVEILIEDQAEAQAPHPSSSNPPLDWRPGVSGSFIISIPDRQRAGSA